MEKVYNYVEKATKSEISIIKKEEPTVVLRNIFTIKNKVSNNVENLEFSFCKKLISGRSFFSKKGFKRFFGIAKNNEKMVEISAISATIAGVVAVVSLLLFMLTSIDLSVSNEAKEVVSNPRTVGEVADNMAHTVKTMTNLIFPIMGLMMFVLGLFSLKRYADDPRQNSLMKGMVFLMTGSLFLSFTTLTSMVAQ